MENLFVSFFEKENIEFYSCKKITDEYVVSPRKLPDFAKYVTVFLIPYKTELACRNISFYAVAKDYHFYIKELSERLESFVAKKAFDSKYHLFSDNSPFDERKLANDLGLGFVGKNRLLINEKYGSYIFVGEIVTERPPMAPHESLEPHRECLSCGKCAKACPSGCLGAGDAQSECMSALTQKKNLSPDEERKVADHYLVWGCDICQEVCPHNISAAETPIGFFKTDLVPILSTELIKNMSDDQFGKRAFAWRGKKTVLRNTSLKNI